MWYQKNMYRLIFHLKIDRLYQDSHLDPVPLSEYKFSNVEASSISNVATIFPCLFDGFSQSLSFRVISFQFSPFHFLNVSYLLQCPIHFTLSSKKTIQPINLWLMRLRSMLLTPLQPLQLLMGLINALSQRQFTASMRRL